MQRKIDAAVERHAIRYIGPNCIGFVNSRAGVNTTPFPYDGRKGGVGLASHSGSYVCHALSLAEDMDLGLAEWFSMGNEASLDVADALDYFREHPDIRVVGLYLEGIRRPQAFKEAALRLVGEKPVVAIYPGGSPEGARSAASHTAAVSSSGKVMRGFLRQCGILQAETSNELYEWLYAFDTQPLPKGPRVAILANSGGPATSMADQVGRSELELPRFSPELAEKIAKLMPHTGSGQNPIDLTFSPDPGVFSGKLPRLLVESDEIDAILVYGVFGATLWQRLVARVQGQMPPEMEKLFFQAADAQADVMYKAFAGCGKPVIGASFDVRKDSSVRRMMEKGNVPFCNGPERAAKALEAMWRYVKIREEVS